MPRVCLCASLSMTTTCQCFFFPCLLVLLCYLPQRDLPFKLFFCVPLAFTRLLNHQLHPSLSRPPSLSCVLSLTLALSHSPVPPPFVHLVLASYLRVSPIAPDTASPHNLSEFAFFWVWTMTENGSMYTFWCSLNNCSRWFKNLTGLTQHIQAKHPNKDVDMNTGASLNWVRPFRHWSKHYQPFGMIRTWRRNCMKYWGLRLHQGRSWWCSSALSIEHQFI